MRGCSWDAASSVRVLPFHFAANSAGCIRRILALARHAQLRRMATLASIGIREREEPDVVRPGQQVPDWFGKPYGNYSQNDWDDAAREAREVLVPLAMRGGTTTYGGLITHVVHLDWPEGAYTHRGSQVGRLLADVSMAEWLQNRPLLSALVVNAAGSENAGEPADGFYSLCVDAGLLVSKEDPNRQAVWVDQLNACYAERGW